MHDGTVAQPGGVSPPDTGGLWARLRWIFQIPIAARIVILGLLGLGAFGGAVAIHVVADRASQIASERRSLVTDMTSRVQSLELTAADLRLAKASYAQERTIALDRFAALAREGGATLERVADLATRAGLGAGVADPLARLSEGLTTLTPQMRTAAAAIDAVGLSDDEGLRSDLKAIIQGVETELAQWPSVGAILAKLSQVKRYEQAFLVNPDAEALGRLRKAANELDFALMGGPFDADTAGRLSQAVTAYVATLKTYIAAVESRESALAAVDLALDAINADLARLLEVGTDNLVEAQAAAARVRANMLGLLYWGGGLLLVVFLGASVLVARSIYLPIDRIERAMRALAAGASGVEVPGLGRRDEIGRMAQAIAVFKRNAAEVEALQADRLRQEEDAERHRREALLALADAFEQSVRHLASDLSAAADAITAQGQEMTAEAGTSHAVGDQVAQSIAAAAATMTEVRAQAEALARSAGLVQTRLTESQTAIDGALAEAQAANDRVGGLAEAADRIGEVVDLITAISAQTHLLALNATIEAARAGEAGRGFAIVAGEVKTLAQRTNAATEDITAHIARIRSEIGATVSGIGRVGEGVSRAHDIAGALSQAMGDQEQAMGGIGQALEGAMALMAGVTGHLETMAGSMTATVRASGAVEDTARHLTDQSRGLERELDRFLAQVRCGSAGGSGAEDGRVGPTQVWCDVTARTTEADQANPARVMPGDRMRRPDATVAADPVWNLGRAA